MTIGMRLLRIQQKWKISAKLFVKRKGGNEVKRNNFDLSHLLVQYSLAATERKLDHSCKKPNA